MGLVSLTAVRVEPCRHYAKRHHRLSLPGVAEPVEYVMPHCLRTDSYRGPDGLLAVDPEGSGAPDGGQPCGCGRGCYLPDVLELL